MPIYTTIFVVYLGHSSAAKTVFPNRRALAAASDVFDAARRLRIVNSKVSLDFMLCLAETESTHSSECDSRCNEQLGLVSPWCWRALAATSGVFASARRLRIVNSKVSFAFYPLFSLYREHSSQRGWFSLQRVGSGWEALFVEAWRCNELVCHCSEIIIPLQRVCFSPQRKVTALWGFNVQCNCWGAKDVMPWIWVAKTDVLDWTCLNAPCCWGCMIDEVSTVEELKTQCHKYGLLRPTCWVGHV